MSDETKIVNKIEKQRSTDYVTNHGSHIQTTPKSFSVYGSDPREPHNGSIHFNKQDNGSFKVVEKKDGVKTESSCYLTTACLKHFAEHFHDDCYELTTLRWFRDNFVKQDDISMYYQIAPLVVEQINLLSDEEQNTIYNDIYNNVISVCVKLIESKKYDLAYNKYKESVIRLKSQFMPSLA